MPCDPAPELAKRPIVGRGRLLLVWAGLMVFTTQSVSAEFSATTASGLDENGYEAELAAFEQVRVALANDALTAIGPAKKQSVRDDARRTILRFLDETVFPAWRGTRWAMGGSATAVRPHQMGRAIGCGFFVAAALIDAGLHLDSRSRFGRGAAIDIQRSLAGPNSPVHRFINMSSDQLAEAVVVLGDGLYLIGLRQHVGFVRVQDDQAMLIHSGAAGKRAVQIEPLADAASVRASHPSGYWLTLVIADPHRADSHQINRATDRALQKASHSHDNGMTDDDVIDHWLRGQPVRFHQHGLPPSEAVIRVAGAKAIYK